jgi:hypothetical protein
MATNGRTTTMRTIMITAVLERLTSETPRRLCEVARIENASR